MISKEEIIRSEYPLHWAVFRNDFQDLSRLLEEKSESEVLNKLDVRDKFFNI